MEEKRRNARSEKPCAGAGLEKEQEAGGSRKVGGCSWMPADPRQKGEAVLCVW